MDTFNIALVTLGAFILLVGVFSIPLQRLPLSMPLLALCLGVLVGPQGLRWLQPTSLANPQTVLEQVARLTLAVSVMGAALRLPRSFLPQHWRSFAALLLIVMPLMWLVSSFLVWGLLDVRPLIALLVGAIICPTDPVLAGSIVTGKLANTHIPAPLRHTITTESAANDGLGYPFVLLPLLLLDHTTGTALPEWLLRVLVWEVGLAIVLGALLGYAAGKLLLLAERKHSIEEHSFLGFTLALTLVALAGPKLLGCDGILSVFAAGIGLQFAIDAKDRHAEEKIQETVNQFLSLPIFIFLGIMLPWQDWLALGWPAVVFVVAVLLLRRWPVLIAMRPLVPTLHNRREASFAGWFGPIGVAAIYYATYAERHAQLHQAWVIASLVICASVIVHGVSAAPLTRRFDRSG